MKMADLKWPEEQLRVSRDLDAYAMADIYGKMSMAVADALFDKKKGGADVLVPEYNAALNRSQGFVVALLMFDKWWIDEISYSFYTNDHKLKEGFGAAIKLALTNAAQSAEKGGLFEHPHAKDLVGYWARLVCHCEDEACVRAFRKYYDKACSVNEATPVYVLQSCRKLVLKDNDNKFSYTLDYDWFENTLGFEITPSAVSQLQSLRNRKLLDERDSILVKCLESAIEQKKKSSP